MSAQLVGAIKQNLHLSIPIALNSLLGVASSIVSMCIMALLGTNALAAGGLIAGTYGFLIMFAMAYAFPVGILIGQAMGGKRHDDIAAIVQSGLFVVTLLCVPVIVIMLKIQLPLSWLKQPVLAVDLTSQYFHYAAFGFLPILWSCVLAQLFIAVGRPKPTVVLAGLSLVIIPILTYLLMFGLAGFPKMGIAGAAIAATISAWLNFFLAITYILTSSFYKKFSIFSVRNLSYKQAIFQLGWPISIQYSSELTAIAFVVYMIGLFGIGALAAQQILLQYTSLVIMIPLAISQASSILVGRSVGEQKPLMINQHLKAALIIGFVVSIFIAILYICIPRQLTSIYLDINHLNNQNVFHLAVLFLMIAGLSQVFDSIRNIITSVFRGTGDTKTPMLIAVLACWGIGIPSALLLGFGGHYGPIGIRIGFTLGIIAGTVLIAQYWFNGKRELMLATSSVSDY